MWLFTVCYGTGCLSFLILIGLMLARQRPTGIGLVLLVVCLLSAAWALVAALQPWWWPGLAHLLDCIRMAAWLEFLALVFVSAGQRHRIPAGIAYRVLVPTLCLATAANDLRFLGIATAPAAFGASQIFFRIVMAVCGLLLVENLFRNIPHARRWHILPLCIATGGLFAYDLLVFSDAVILRHIDPVLLAGRGIFLVLMTPLLMVGMARNQNWNIDIHVSRRVAFHTATLTISGMFLIVAAGVAGFIGRVPGDAGVLLKLTFFAGSVLALAMFLSVASFRSRLGRALSENFFSARYDYRVEWMRCIGTLSSSADGEPLQTRVVQALADVVDSPGGVLWLDDGKGTYRPAASLSAKMESHTPELADGPFIAGFEQGKSVQVFDANPPHVPAWARDGFWLAVPLMLGNDLFGFVALLQPRAPAALTWESFQLLLTIGRQCASWLSAEISAQVLAESRALFEYGKRFSFVAHDVKNVSGQLTMMIANMKKFGDQPEFRRDMMKTMDASISRLNRLLERLRSDGPGAGKGSFDLTAVVESVLRELNCASVHCERLGAPAPCESVSEQDLHSVLIHLLTNSIEASESGSPIKLLLGGDERETVITVVDQGCGMPAEFVRDELFRPRRSTKAGGHGVGAYQARELVRAAGGELTVTSAPGLGTSVRVSLPRRAVSSISPVQRVAVLQ